MVLASFLTSVATAQDSHQTALARALFEEGLALADANEWAGAADRFGRAYALKPTSGIAFNWASALAATGKLVQASELLQSILRNDAAPADLKRETEQKLAELSPRIPRLKLSVERELARSGTVSVDGREWPRAVWDVASPIDPGAHVASCRNAEAELARVELVLAEGEQKHVLLSTEPAPGAATDSAGGERPRGEHDRPRRLYKSWVLWTVVGVAVMGGVVAVAVASSKGEERAGPMAQGNTGAGVIRW